ncbi:putative G-protein coupled receptor C06G4.5 [Ditylenchus destructor]|uniref:G-protein coupled receptor C06G4.5 n=1 Tax=Ditylenchus destructor TaxID=166010 RepID=A0AAD4NKT9_9BILA|nr:putative G-protein coupled receptor C06G4.5 [Ditylenchus destructor]
MESFDVATSTQTTFAGPPNFPAIRMMVYPPVSHESSTKRISLCLYLLVCLTVGICGNFSQLALQFYSFRLRIGCSDFSPNFTQVCIGILHGACLFFSMSLPSIIIERLVGVWMYGIAACISQTLLSAFGRTAIAWMIVCIFVDQLAISHPNGVKCHIQRRIFCIYLLCISVLAMASSLPSMVYLNVIESEFIEEQGDEISIRMRSSKCIVEAPSNFVKLLLILVSFTIDFLLPVSLCIACIVSIRRILIMNRNVAIFFDKRIHKIRIFVSAQRSTIASSAEEICKYLPYALVAVVWIPLSYLSNGLSTQAKFYYSTSRPQIRTSLRRTCRDVNTQHYLVSSTINSSGSANQPLIPLEASFQQNSKREENDVIHSQHLMCRERANTNYELCSFSQDISHVHELTYLKPPMMHLKSNTCSTLIRQQSQENGASVHNIHRAPMPHRWSADANTFLN